MLELFHVALSTILLTHLKSYCNQTPQLWTIQKNTTMTYHTRMSKVNPGSILDCNTNKLDNKD